MSDSIYVKVGDAVQQLELGAAPEYVQRIAALEAGQTSQDTAISNAATAAANAQSSANAAQQSANNAQTTADEAKAAAEEAKDAAENITVPVTSVNGQTGAVTVGTVRTVNGVEADAAGNVAVDESVYLTESWRNGYSWYRKYSDGWIEQGGVSYNAYTNRKITFHVPMNTAVCSITFGEVRHDTYAYPIFVQNSGGPVVTSTYFQCVNNDMTGMFWIARGYV